MKAIEELKEGLDAHELTHVIEDDLAATSDDMSQLLDMVFSPDDTILIGGDEPPTFNTEGEDMLGEALPPRSYQRNLEELDALLGSVGSLGFGLTTKEDEEAANADDDIGRVALTGARFRAPLLCRYVSFPRKGVWIAEPASRAAVPREGAA